MPKLGATARQVELERKFAVPDGAGWPSFDGLPGVSRTEQLPARALEAVYYDTDRHDLSAHRIALRRRTGGPDEGWHLKLPTAAGADAEARTEIHAPLGPELPDALRDVVLAIVRNRPLVPVARIANSRHVTMLFGDDGSELAEFCQDQVTAARLDPVSGDAETQVQWQEWELEVIDGTTPGAAKLLDRLTSRLHKAGATPAGHVSKLAKVLGDVPPRPETPADPVHRAVAAQVARLLECDRAVRADAEDSVHQMRVATRQIRSLLQASEEEFGLTDDAWILGELRELAAVLGIARDAEVLAERYRAALDALPPELIRGPVRDRLVEGARRRYQSGLRRSLNAMRSARYFRLLDALDTVVVTPSPAEDRRGHASIARSYRKLRKAAQAAEVTSGTERDHLLHAIRKAAKRLRYVAAATGDSKVESRAKEIQTLLGEHQDSVVSREHLLAQTEAARAAFEETFTYGVLYQQERALAQSCQDQLDAALDAVHRSAAGRRRRR